MIFAAVWMTSRLPSGHLGRPGKRTRYRVRPTLGDQPVSRRVYRQLSQLARPMTSHMKPTPRTVQAKVRRLG